MNFVSLILLAVSLAMDSFSVSISKGLCVADNSRSGALKCGFWFGAFQGGMPLIGFLLGIRFLDYIATFDHWVAFILLALIGGNMIKESFSDKEESSFASMAAKDMFILAVATSIDALAVGIALAMEGDTNIYLAVLLIGVVTFFISAFGFKVATKLGGKYGNKATLVGGLILVFLGVKILVEHLGIFADFLG